MSRGISRYLHDRDWHSRADTILLRTEKPFDESTSGLFIGRESYGRDGALTNAKICRLFGPKRIWDPLARMLRVNFDDDVGVIGVDDDRVMRTAPLGVGSGAVVGVVMGCPLG